MSGDRFTLLLLEPGEIYFQDLAVNYIYDETKALTQDNLTQGWLKICSKSIVFVPIKERNKDPLLKFPLNDVSEIKGKLFELIFRHVTLEENKFFYAKMHETFFLSKILTPCGLTNFSYDFQNGFPNRFDRP